VWEKGEGKSILAVVPSLNEEWGVGPTIAELRRYLGKPWILIVDGWSFDKTVKIAKDMGADVIFQQGNGKGDAIAEAIRYVKDNIGFIDYVVFTDADYTYPAEFIPKMIRILEENPDVGMVCGNRFNSHFRLRALRSMFYVGNRLLALTHNLLTGVDMRDPLTGLRVLRWEILKDWQPKSKSFDVEVELNHLVEGKGYRIVEIPIYYRPRLGDKKLKPKHGFTILKRILLESL